MEFRLVMVIVVIALVMNEMVMVQAEFLYNRILPHENDLEELGLECIPGRTIIKVQEFVPNNGTDSSEEDTGRRTHMNFKTDDESCRVCVCSVEGKDEYCSNRPAKNVNECVRMATLMGNFQNNIPYEHERDLSNRIRRDYVWHKDEIPYDAKARCRRGTSYYSNSINANDTDIDIPSDIDSLLDYSNLDVCFYCVCHVSGNSVGCISRNPWFCQYYRLTRQTDYARDYYRNLLQQDRPVYFRQLSYRLRRTMDSGMFDLVEAGGDSLCCGHEAGHRRQLLTKVRRKLKQIKNKVNKENLMNKTPVGDYVDFVVNND